MLHPRTVPQVKTGRQGRCPKTQRVRALGRGGRFMRETGAVKIRDRYAVKYVPGPRSGAKPVAWSQVVAVCLPSGRHAGRPRRPGGRRRTSGLLRGGGPSGSSWGVGFPARGMRTPAAGLPPGALPPDPRSLSLERTPADQRKKKGQAVTAAGPSAVRPAVGRSGRTPAEPYPPNGQEELTIKEPWRPPLEHPWRKFRIKRQAKQEDILTLAK